MNTKVKSDWKKFEKEEILREVTNIRFNYMQKKLTYNTSAKAGNSRIETSVYRLTGSFTLQIQRTIFVDEPTDKRGTKEKNLRDMD